MGSLSDVEISLARAVAHQADATLKRAEGVASREKEKERARHLRDWARLAVRRDEQRSWGKVLSESTERIEPAGVLTYSLKEVFELPAD